MYSVNGLMRFFITVNLVCLESSETSYFSECKNKTNN